MSNVYGYVRVSTSEQARDGISLDAQREAIVQYASAFDLPLADILVDEGRSAKSMKGRPELGKLLALVDEGQVSAIIIYKLNRMFRSVRDGVNTIPDLDEKGVRFHSVSERIDTGTAMGKFMIHMLLSIAQLDRDQISETTSDTLAWKRHQAGGRPINGRAPFGLMWREGRLVACPAEERIVQKIVALRAQGLTLAQVARRLNAAGATTRGGTPWQAHHVWAVAKRTAHPLPPAGSLPAGV